MIEAVDLTRVFKTGKSTVEAVRGVTLSVEAGEIVGFLGPNGAGKTTTLRMLATLLRPTSGSATVAGADLLNDPVGVRRRIGYVGQAMGKFGGGSDPNCRVNEEIIVQAQLYRHSKAYAVERAERLMSQLDLGGLGRRLIKTLSGGERRRLDIALGLVHDPELVFLDEPSTGLDPQSRSNLWEHVRKLRADLNTTVYITTHYLDEADALCDRILVIDRGKIVAEGTPQQLKQRVAGDVVTLVVDCEAARAAEHLEGRRGVRDVKADDHTVRLTVEHGDQALPWILETLSGTGITMTSVQLTRPTLDDVFLTLTGRSLRDGS
ncbi:ATP-binding cassette domain-containing protein [Actinomadura barringtoniae]|uniref:ATP-binding cassette domain-containing protein n=1 Tax=Actinomadura barringtoniae TaxID=1427535 RepID=A0A939P5L9_9ACTN|nr:ATP-binding cassette domain-containing protein [Actinomadura barringtoniae]MBO2445595.1 ATP-binding cassette domain-containing protein [Actinomadura barringtoniae]